MDNSNRNLFNKPVSSNLSSTRRLKRPGSPSLTQPPNSNETSTPYPPIGLGHSATNDHDNLEKSSAVVMRKYLSLEKQLRGERQATQLRAIAEFASLFDAHPSPNLINSGLLKLSELFYLLGNGPRMMICQTFHAAQPHLPMVSNLDVVTSHIGSLSTSNDYLARSLCLKTLSVLSKQLADRLDIHYLILKGLEAEEELEQTISLEFASIMAQYSFDFAKTVLPKLKSLLSQSLHPRLFQRVVAALRTLRNHVELAVQARDICLNLLTQPNFTNIGFAQMLLDSSTHLSVIDSDMAANQVERLFEILSGSLTGLAQEPIRRSGLSSLQQISQAQHKINNHHFQQLIKIAQEPGCSSFEKTQILMVIKFATNQESILSSFMSESSLPPLPETSQVYYWVLNQADSIQREPFDISPGLLGLLLEQFQLPFASSSIKMEDCLETSAPTFSRVVLAGQILRSLVSKGSLGSDSQYFLRLAILRLWIVLVQSELSLVKLRVLLDTLAGLLASWVCLDWPTIPDNQRLPLSSSGRLDVDIILITLHLIQYAKTASETAAETKTDSHNPQPFSSNLTAPDKVHLVCTWIIVYSTTYLASKPKSEVLSLEAIAPFMNDNSLLTPLICLTVHLSSSPLTWLVDAMKGFQPRTDKHASLGAMACYAHRAAHHELASVLLPEVLPRVFMDTTRFFLQGLYAWSQGESKLNLHLACCFDFPDSVWCSELSSIVAALYRAGSCFQAWAAATEHSSPFPAWWIQIRCEILSTLRLILGIIIMLPGSATPFHLNLLSQQVNSLANIRRKLRFVKTRFYHLDTITQHTLDDTQLQLTALTLLMVHSLQIHTSGNLTEFAFTQPETCLQRPGQKLAFSIYSLAESSQPPAITLWTAISRFLKQPHPSPPAIYHSRDSYYIDLSMEPCGVSLKIAEGTIFKFSGSVKQVQHSQMDSIISPTKIKIHLYTASYPHHDLPHSLNSQLENIRDESSGWVNEIALSNEGNFHVTAALPPHLRLVPGHLHVKCWLFNPAQRCYFPTGPVFSIPINN